MTRLIARIQKRVSAVPAMDKSLVLLLIIVAVALILRTWGTSFGLPFVYHPDEGIEVNRALQLGTGDFDFGTFRMLKGGYFYLLFVEFGFIFVILKLLGVVASTQDFAHLYLSNPTIFYLVGRVTTAVIGSASVYLIYLIGERLHSKRVGLVASLLLAVNLFHVEHSHYITVDVPLTCLSLACLLFIIKIDDMGKPGDYIWAAIFLGLATITKLPGILLIIPFALAHLRRSRSERGPFIRALINRNIIVAVTLFAVVFFLSNPGALIHFDDFVEMVLSLVWQRPEPTIEASSVAVNNSPLHFDFYFRAVQSAHGWPILFMAILGGAFAIQRRMYTSLILLVYGVCFFLVISVSANRFLVYERYILPIVPLVTLFAALGVEAISTFLGRILPAQKGAVLVMGLALASTPLIASIRMDSAFLATDTRTLAKQWFEGKVPDGATVLTEGHTAKSFNTSVQLANSRENLEHAIAHFKAMGDNGKARYFEYELEVTRARRYDLIFYNWDNLDRWESYKSLQVEYVVIRPADLLGNEKYEGFGEKFLESLRSDPDYWLAAQFDSEAGEFRGPTIEIYMRRLPGLP